MILRIWQNLSMPTRTGPASALAYGIASALNDFKLEHPYTGVALAAKTGLDPSQISRWENARVDISVRDLKVLCAGLGIDWHAFLDDAEERAARYELRTSRPESTTPDPA
jgi:transcriptional regulator with XRE-family HTH domain